MQGAPHRAAIPALSPSLRRRRWGMGVAGMARVIGRDEGPLAPALRQGPAVDALEVVVVGAQPIEQVEDGEVAGGPGQAVVVLQPGGDRAALGRTAGKEPLQSARRAPIEAPLTSLDAWP